MLEKIPEASEAVASEAAPGSATLENQTSAVPSSNPTLSSSDSDLDDVPIGQRIKSLQKHSSKSQQTTQQTTLQEEQTSAAAEGSDDPEEPPMLVCYFSSFKCISDIQKKLRNTNLIK